MVVKSPRGPARVWPTRDGAEWKLMVMLAPGWKPDPARRTVAPRRTSCKLVCNAMVGLVDPGTSDDPLPDPGDVPPPA